MSINLRTRKQFLRICEDLKRFSERLHTQFPDAYISLEDKEISLIEKTEDSFNTVSSVSLLNFSSEKEDKNTKEIRETQKIEDTKETDLLLNAKEHLLNTLKTKQNNKIFTIKSIVGSFWSDLSVGEQKDISFWFQENVKSKKIKDVKFSHSRKNNRFYIIART